MKVVIALGSNLGDRRATLDSAVLAISEFLGDIKISTYLETAPVGGPEQPDYLNAVMVGESDLEPITILERLREIESSAGRQRTVHWGARTLDLDLIAVGDLIIESEFLTLPHPRAHERRFVLDPWLEIDPDGFLPGYGKVGLIP